jgi:hypothetical protein
MAKKNEDEVIKEIRRMIFERYRTQAKAAEVLKLSDKDLSLMLNKHKPLSVPLLQAVGFRRIETPAYYVKA